MCVAFARAIGEIVLRFYCILCSLFVLFYFESELAVDRTRELELKFLVCVFVARSILPPVCFFFLSLSFFTLTLPSIKRCMYKTRCRRVSARIDARAFRPKGKSDCTIFFVFNYTYHRYIFAYTGRTSNRDDSPSRRVCNRPLEIETRRLGSKSCSSSFRYNSFTLSLFLGNVLNVRRTVSLPTVSHLDYCHEILQRAGLIARPDVARYISRFPLYNIDSRYLVKSYVS